MSPQKKRTDYTKKLEFLGILIMVTALMIFLAVVSYHPSDYPNSGSPANVQNWLGLGGAWISYYLYVYTIGYACLVFPFLLFLLGWNILLQKNFLPFFRFGLYVLALGIFLSVALAMPQAVSGDSRYGFRISGLLGGFFAQQMGHYLGMVGSVIVLLTSLLLFLVSATSWSIRESMLEFREGIQFIGKLIPKSNRRSGRKAEGRDIPRHMKIQDAPAVSGHKRKDTMPARHDASVSAASREPVQIHMPDQKQRTASVSPESKIIRQPVSPSGEYVMPSLNYLDPVSAQNFQVDRKILEKKAGFLEEKLREFDVLGTVTGVQPGPVITRFEIRPDPGVKVSRFTGIQDDLALVMRASRVRVQAPIPGKGAVGIEIPNEEAALVSLRTILESEVFQQSRSKLTLALGLTIEGLPYVADLAQMPHLLVAGATGSGKSVCLNTIITSILYRAKPSDVKFVMIDPKKLELSLYRKLRRHHLTTREGLGEDVITSIENAVAVLKSMEREMERRYRILAKIGVRNIDDYNKAVTSGRIPPTDTGKTYQKLPFLVLVVDELADLMISGAREVEEPIARLAQMSRAVGIHLILATQRPSVDVITGVIKANFPSRIAFQVAAKTDSRTILDRNGAEKLLGRGDMLFMNPREPEPIRIHGAYISTEEVRKVVRHVSQQPHGELYRLPGVESQSAQSADRRGDRDELFKEAARLVIRHQQGSASLLQRRLRVGYARAGRLIDELEDAGLLGPFDGSKARQVLVDESFLDKLDDLENRKAEDDIP